MQNDKSKKILLPLLGTVAALAIIGFFISRAIPKQPNDISRIYTEKDFRSEKLDPESLARLVKKLNDDNQALAKNDPQVNTYAAWIDIGNTKLALNDLKGSEAAYLKAIEVNDKGPLAYLNLGTLFKLHLKDNLKAEYYYLRALERIDVPYFSDYESVADLYVNFYTEKKVDIEALMLQGADKVSGSSKIAFYEYLRDYFKERDPQKKTLYEKKVLEIDPTHSFK